MILVLLNDASKFILGPAGERIAFTGLFGVLLMYALPNPWPLAAAPKSRMTPAGQPASASAPEGSDVDTKANLSSQPTERSKQ